MTPEQLDEIENRQAAATWIGGPTAAFAQDTLMLVKALREAQKERDEARAEIERLREVVRQVRVEAETALDAMESFWPGSTIHAAINDIHTLTKEKP